MGNFIFHTLGPTPIYLAPGQTFKPTSVILENRNASGVFQVMSLAFYSESGVALSSVYWIRGRSSDYLYHGQTKTYRNASFTILDVPAALRNTRMKLVGVAYASDGQTEIDRFEQQLPTRYLDVYCHPQIPTFDLQRVNASGDPDESGTKLAMTAQITFAATSQIASWTVALDYQGENVSGSVDLTSSLQTLVAGVTDDTALLSAYTFTNGEDIAFTLRVYDTGESASATDEIFRAFANFHLSGAALGGAAFGRFSSADDTHPKLECEYPAWFSQPVHADGGIAGVTTYPLLASGETMTAEELTGGKWIDGKPIYRVVISKTVTLAADTQVATMPAYETIVSCHCLAKIGSETKPVSYCYYNNDNWEINWTIQANGNIVMQAGSSHRKSARVQFIIEYTKSTD